MGVSTRVRCTCVRVCRCAGMQVGGETACGWWWCDAMRVNAKERKAETAQSSPLQREFRVE